MCGIAGFVDFWDTKNVRDREDRACILENMCEVIRYRGPDDSGSMLKDGVALGMRRLSIIDLAGGAVTFLGGQPPEGVRQELRRSRCFVQHSVESSMGDSEGTPVSILEAGATGLPVVSTRHAGIPDVVIEGETGFLVDERDVDAMAQHMTRIVEEPGLARELGLAARRRIQQHFAKEQQLGGLWRIIESCIRSRMLAKEDR